MKTINKFSAEGGSASGGKNNSGHVPTPERKSYRFNVKDVNFCPSTPNFGVGVNLVRGQAMVEAIVAMSVIVVGLLGVFTLSSNSISLNRVAADRYIAVNLANEGVELVKNLIDNNEWNAIPGFENGTYQYEIDFNDLEVGPLGKESSGGGARQIYFSKDGSGYYAYDDGDLNPSYIPTVQDLTRIITIENVDMDGEHKKVVSTVSWKAKDGAMLSFFVEDHFYNLKNSGL